jgi:hypothetical protein
MNKNPGLWFLLSLGVVLWNLIEMTSGGEAPGQAVMVMHWITLICGAVGLVGSVVLYAQKRGEDDRR